jgi:hypothetical protein
VETNSEAVAQRHDIAGCFRHTHRGVRPRHESGVTDQHGGSADHTRCLVVEQFAIERHVRELDRLGEDLAVLDRQIAEGSTDDPAARRLFTITGVDLTVATGLMAAIGNISRFEVDLFDFAPWGTCSSRGSFEGDAHRNSTMEKVVDVDFHLTWTTPFSSRSAMECASAWMDRMRHRRRCCIVGDRVVLAITRSPKAAASRPLPNATASNSPGLHSSRRPSSRWCWHDGTAI